MDPNTWTEATVRAVNRAHTLGVEAGHSQLTPAAVALALLEESTSLCSRLVSKAGGDRNVLLTELKLVWSKMPKQTPSPEQLSPSTGLMAVFRQAVGYQKKVGDTYLSVDTLLKAVANDSSVKSAFIKANFGAAAVDQAIKETRGVSGKKVDSRNAEDKFEMLEKFGRDLVQDALDGKLDPVIGRNEEISRCIQILQRKTKNNPCLVGEPGVGKTAIVEGLAQRILAGDIPDTLNSKLFSLDIGALVAGAKYKGEFEERLKGVLDEIAKSKSNIILFIDEAHLLMGAGKGDGSVDAANLLKPMLARGELRCIMATTFDEYRKHIEKDKAFSRRLQAVQVAEPSVEDTVSILRGIKDSYQSHHGVTIQDSAIVMAAKLAKRYITQRHLPDSAIDLMDEAAARVRVQLDSQPEEIDRLERRLLQLEVEETALKQEKDKQSKNRLQACQHEISSINEQLRPLRLKHQEEKGRVDEIRRLRNKLKELDQKIAQAERDRDLGKVADLRYGAKPEIEAHIAKLTTEDAQRKQDDTDRLLTEVITVREIAQVVSRATGIPVDRLQSSESDKLLQLSTRMKERVIGQDPAIDAVCDSVIRARAGLAPPNRPLGSFLFLGSSGVGKTETAKALSKELFDDEGAMIRIDMSEYMEKHAVSRLLGAPPGYVGYEEGGELTEAIRRKPFAVILMDEVEKAHKDVFNVLLQVLDDGRLTDAQGHVVDFKNTVIIMTSNIGSQYLIDASTSVRKSGGGSLPQDSSSDDDERLDLSMREAKEMVQRDLKAHFRPEFLNRIDDIVIFEPLKISNLQAIVKQQIDLIMKGLLQDRNIQVNASTVALNEIIRESFNPAYGARPLRRYIERNIATEIGRSIIKGDIKDSSAVLIEGVKEKKRAFEGDYHHEGEVVLPTNKRLKLSISVNKVEEDGDVFMLPSKY